MEIQADKGPPLFVFLPGKLRGATTLMIYSDTDMPYKLHRKWSGTESGNMPFRQKGKHVQNLESKRNRGFARNFCRT